MPHSIAVLKNEHELDKLVAILGYFTLVGWMIAILMYGSHRSALARFHLRQSLGLTITGAILSFIPLVGWVLCLGVVLAWFLGVYYAITGHKLAVPLLGDFYQRHLTFIV
jgi:uncharacterized membrane protein